MSSIPSSRQAPENAPPRRASMSALCASCRSGIRPLLEMDWAAKEGDEEAERVENSEKEPRSFFGEEEDGRGDRKEEKEKLNSFLPRVTTSSLFIMAGSKK